ncbi:hypothetical protein PCASD_02020 [Puccinia coronata f. sp. avenae]|uniref:Integrase catalytic domain-containing protein n=1 Tax=Puccinia coronata f. sp. avenae TaxID=200324 RepID=A0A2N5VHD9_9BASI|nr:hypothetical protein PCASD_02020 [Puccinia coronata f. sp. avenae]
MKKLITDGGGEFCNNTLSDVLKTCGIQHNVAPPYTPQHNGIAERANKTIINMACCMMVQSRLAKEWWGEAVRTAALTTNCLPSLIKTMTTPATECPDLFPHSRLPDFSSSSSLPFEDDDNDGSFSSVQADESHLESTTPSRRKDEVTSKRSLEQEDEDMDTDGDADRLVDDEDPLPPPTRRLVLCLGPHPTRIDSSINSDNILSCRTRNVVAFSVTSTKPSNHARAMACDDCEQWKKAEEVEIANMISHNVWEVIPLQPHHHTIPSTWAYKKKLGADNQVVEYKARICAQGFRQTYGLNFDLKYAPTGKPSSLRFLLSIANERGLLVHQLDVKSAFLTCNLEEEVLMLPPAGYLSD